MSRMNDEIKYLYAALSPGDRIIVDDTVHKLFLSQAQTRIDGQKETAPSVTSTGAARRKTF